MRRSTVAAIVAAIFILSPATLMANVIPPIGLAPGSQYQLIFVTSGTITAERSDIHDYNAFVSSHATFGATFFGLPTGVSWHAVASTASIDARDNAPSAGLPVYNTAGQLVAASTIYGGSLLAPVFYDENGFSYDITNVAVWTGTAPDGTGAIGHTLGATGGQAVTGLAGGAGDFWIDSQSIRFDVPWALYGLSDPITLPAPEPGTLTLAASALSLVGLFRLLAHRRRSTIAN